ncbi:SMI1/KNR4 family protein [bacterium]|nr:MAG: SMI1/KNR4 family protein [bacterium]
MDRFDDLIQRIKVRVADPLRARDTAAWTRPLRPLPPPVTDTDLDAAEAALGFAMPPLLRRLYTEVANGRWGPDSGLGGIPSNGAEPEAGDIVSFYQECVSPDRDLENPAVRWPCGLVTLINSHQMEVCDFLTPTYPLYLLDIEEWDLDRPVVESLVLIAASLEERLESWLSGPT